MSHRGFLPDNMETSEKPLKPLVRPLYPAG